jgi:hypothetical protein
LICKKKTYFQKIINRDSQSSGFKGGFKGGLNLNWLLMKLQVEAPLEELQSFKVASAFGSFTIQEPNLNAFNFHLKSTVPRMKRLFKRT